MSVASGRWIFNSSRHGLGKFPPLATSTSGNNCYMLAETRVSDISYFNINLLNIQIQASRKIRQTKINEHLKTLIGINYIDKQESTNNSKSSVLIHCPCRDVAQKAKSWGGTLRLVTRPYIKESTYSWNIQSLPPQGFHPEGEIPRKHSSNSRVY